jgi:SAM-dependent methyltransferase
MQRSSTSAAAHHVWSMRWSRNDFAQLACSTFRKRRCRSRARLSARGEGVDWIVADITRWQPAKTYDVWHDRAVFHFLREPADRAAYAARVRQAVRPGGHLIIGTFAPDGPERCSGLPIMRHDAASIAQTLGDAFQLMETRRHDHVTPAGSIQHFQFSRFRRSDG